MQSIVTRVGLVTIALALCHSAIADVRPNPIFSDNAVLQQGMPVPVWGTAFDGEKVKVTVNGQTATTTAKGGKWFLKLKPMKAGGPYTLTIEGRNRIVAKNVMVGEVFVCSGQSNMQWSIQASLDPDGVAARSNDPELRLLTVPRTSSVTPQETADISWAASGPNTVRDFSAVAYHFGAAIRKARNVAVGLISTNYGGSSAEAWTHDSTLQGRQDFRWAIDDFNNRLKDYTAQQMQYLDAVAKGQNARRPVSPYLQHNSHPTGLYNAMIVPILPYAFRGAIWYQGESNAGRAWTYRELLPAMVADWRADWGQGDFPFIQVQLAPFMAIEAEPKESNWAELREAQIIAGKTSKNIGSVVITDVGDEKDIHPKAKQPVGERLALVMRHMAFGEKLVYSGPEYAGASFGGGKGTIRFNHVGGGLMAKGDRLTGFAICGKDRKWVNAAAKIVGDRVEVWSDAVSDPVAVRFGWANYPVVNLFNKEGLPAVPFRTDSFPITTQPKQAK